MKTGHYHHQSPAALAQHTRALSFLSFSSFVLDTVLCSHRRVLLFEYSSYKARRAHDDDDRENKHTREKGKKNIASSREERKKIKKNKETQKNALVYPIAERVHQVAPESGDATEQRSVSRSDFGRLRGGGGFFFFFFAASAHDDDFFV